MFSDIFSLHQVTGQLGTHVK